MSAIFVDGDACPVREEIYRVAVRLALDVFVASNGSRPIRPPGTPNVRIVLVGDSADAAATGSRSTFQRWTYARPAVRRGHSYFLLGYREMNPSRFGIATLGNVVSFITSSSPMMPLSRRI